MRGTAIHHRETPVLRPRGRRQQQEDHNCSRERSHGQLWKNRLTLPMRPICSSARRSSG